MGAKRWYNIRFGGIQTNVSRDSSQRVYQSSGQLFIGDFEFSEEVIIFCEDEAHSTVFTELMEGVLVIHSSQKF